MVQIDSLRNFGLYAIIGFLELFQGFLDSVSCVIVRIVFSVRAIVGDALDHDFGIIATGEGAFRVSPIVFGLAFVVARNGPPSFLGLAKMAGRFGRVFGDREVAERVDRIALLARLDDELFWEFVVGETR